MADQSFLAWPFFEDRHRQLAATVRDWAGDRFGETGFADHADVDEDCRQIRSALGAAGLTRNAVPAAFGGMSETLDVRSLCLIREHLAYRSGLAENWLVM